MGSGRCTGPAALQRDGSGEAAGTQGCVHSRCSAGCLPKAALAAGGAAPLPPCRSIGRVPCFAGRGGPQGRLCLGMLRVRGGSALFRAPPASPAPQPRLKAAHCLCRQLGFAAVPGGWRKVGELGEGVPHGHRAGR